MGEVSLCSLKWEEISGELRWGGVSTNRGRAEKGYNNTEIVIENGVLEGGERMDGSSEGV